jgi:vacuolar protein sorting-associated protein 18
MIARLCTERSNKYLKEACVYLYKMLGWYEEAVDLALNVNVDLARNVANSVNSDFGLNISESHTDELKKMLWLRIARHVIEKENDVNKAMSFLHELNETIVIEDVLPYFPDFVTIDQFKDAIRSSLAAYTEKISSLKESIEQAAASAQSIRKDIQTIRQKSINVNTSDVCSKCRFRLMNRRFYVFPCLHKFHSDCLYQTSQPYLLPHRQKRIEELQRLLQDIEAVPILNPTNASSSTMGHSSNVNHFSKTTSKSNQHPQTYSSEEIARLKNELDELLAGECPWCGERILKSIDEPFLDPMQYEAIFNSWL